MTDWVEVGCSAEREETIMMTIIIIMIMIILIMIITIIPLIKVILVTMLIILITSIRGKHSRQSPPGLHSRSTLHKVFTRGPLEVLP